MINSILYYSIIIMNLMFFFSVEQHKNTKYRGTIWWQNIVIFILMDESIAVFNL